MLKAPKHDYARLATFFFRVFIFVFIFIFLPTGWDSVLEDYSQSTLFFISLKASLNCTSFKPPLHSKAEESKPKDKPNMGFENNNYNLSILGCGTMGTAVLNSILSNDTSARPQSISTLTNSERSKSELKAKYGSQIETYLGNKEAIKKADVIILGLKPYMCASVLGQVKEEIKGKLIISLVAGWTIEQLSEYSTKVARVMTNTPAKFGYGMAAISVSDEVAANENHELDTINKLMANIGKTLIIPDSKMDTATSLIGSGPAFVLLMLESMIDSGVKLGLSYEDSRKSVLQVVEGTVKMTEETGLHPAVLKSQVCTPGGTTINGVAKMEELGLRSSIVQGVEKAKDVASQLGKK